MEREATNVSSLSGTSRKRTRTPLDVREEKVVDGFIQKKNKKKKLESKNGIWKELDLALSIQSKDLKSLTKVELAYDFVSSEGQHGDANGDGQCSGRFRISKLASLLGGWIQNVMTSKKLDSWEPCFDVRCWAVLNFCLEKNDFRVSAKFLRSVTLVLSKALSELTTSDDLLLQEKDSVGFYKVFLDCLSLLFDIQRGTINNAGIDLWVSCASAAININVAIFSVNRTQSSTPNDDDVLLHIAFLVLEQFRNFLRVQSNLKQIFISFVDNLLESSVGLLITVHSQTQNSYREFKRKLLGVLEDILSNGLFHPNPGHMSGFMSFKSLYVNREGMYSQSCSESYHRHLFKKVNSMVRKKSYAMVGLGDLFRLFFTRMKKRKEDYASEKKWPHSGNHSEVFSIETQVSNQTIFEVFMLFMEPLIIQCAEMDFDGGISQSILEELKCMLESLNRILANFMHEKLYTPTEDSNEVNYSFLKEVYNTIICVSEKVHQLSLPAVDVLETSYTNAMIEVVKELVVAVGFFLEIEFKVLGDDLVPLWLLLLSSLALYISMDEEKECYLFVKSAIFCLGSQIVKLFMDLRQVLNGPIFALFKAVRIFISGKHGELDRSSSLLCRSFPPEFCSKAITSLLLSQELRSANLQALKSIPEGQAGTYIEQLKLDVLDCFKWLRIRTSSIDELNNTCLDLNLHYEVLGVLSEQYTVLLDAITVTPGNSNSVAKAIEDLIIILAPSFANLTRSKQKSVNDFIYSVTGRRFSNQSMPQSKIGFQGTTLDASWILLFFFRIYVSCRSLYRQTISLIPQNSRKDSAAMDSLFTIYHGENWIGKREWRNRRYFSWLGASSTNSLSTAIQIISNLFQSNKIDHAPLIYALHETALQRLVDLNREIKGFEFLHDRDGRMAMNQMVDGATNSKKIKNEKWKQLIEASKQEALDLSCFITEYLPLKKFSHWSKMCNENWDFCTCSLNEKSLTVAIWWLLCQNLDVWCCHATSKILKKVLSLVIYSALPQKKRSFNDTNEVTVRQISSELLLDTVFYEQKTISLHFISGFLHNFKKSLSSLVSLSGEMHIDLEVLPDWSEVENILDKMSLDTKNVQQDQRQVSPGLCHLEDHSVTESFGMELETCQNLLNLLCGVIKVHINAKSISLLTTYILNLERLIMSSIRKCHEKHFPSNRFELLNLFLSCRRTLRYLALAASDEGLVNKETQIEQVLYVNAFSVSWLMKSASVIVALPYTFFSEEHRCQIKEKFFVLMDNTSYLCLMLTKGLLANCSIIDSDSSEYGDAWKQLDFVANKLKEESENLQSIFKGFVHNAKIESSIDVTNWYRLSNTISCLQGFMWGLVFALNNSNDTSMDRTRDLMLSCMDIFVAFVNFCLGLLVDNKFTESWKLGLDHGCDDHISDVHDVCEMSPSTDGSKLSSIKEGNLPIVVSDEAKAPSTFYLLDLSRLQDFNGSMLRKLLKGKNPERAFLIRQMFISSAAILKLKHISRPTECNHLEMSSTNVLIRMACFVLLEMANNAGVLDLFSFVWLDGTLKYLKEVGHCLFHSDPVLYRNVYAKLIDVHLRAIGKCICLQGRNASLASHEIGSNTKMLHSEMESCENGEYRINDFKERLRMSLRKLIKRATKLHILSAVQAVERALVGVRQECNAIYDINTGDQDGGRASAAVAAGIDCFDLFLEFVSGKKHLGVIKGHIQVITSALFNIILHIRNPRIFLKVKLLDRFSETQPDSGSVILMCIEVLTKVAGKNDWFQMGPSFVGQSLYLPMRLFHDFHQFTVSRGQHHLTTVHSSVLDRQSSVELYAACCKLLCTTLRHHKRESGRCIALLKESVKILLFCLETADADYINKEGFLALEIQDALKCATFLRRVYEEMRQQKDLLAKYSCHFLSTYISVSSRFGPLKSGIKREIEEVVEPGIYALLDICQPSDLQLIHTVLEEGPCRKKLADLQRNYKLRFQYEGKI